MPTKALEGIPFTRGMPAFNCSLSLKMLPVEILLVSPVVSRSNRQIGIRIWKVFGPPSQVAVQRADSMDEEGT